MKKYAIKDIEEITRYNDKKIKRLKAIIQESKGGISKNLLSTGLEVTLDDLKLLYLYDYFRKFSNTIEIEPIKNRIFKELEIRDGDLNELVRDVLVEDGKKEYLSRIDAGETYLTLLAKESPDIDEELESEFLFEEVEEIGKE